MNHQPRQHHITIPAFDGKIHSGAGETKHQSRIRNDKYASSVYRRRLDIDHHNEEKRLQSELREVWE